MAKESNKYLYTHKRFTVIEKCNEVLLTEYSELIKRTPLETFFVPLPKKKKKKAWLSNLKNTLLAQS